MTGSAGATARLWDASTGTPLGSPLRPGGLVDDVQFSPDGNIFLTGTRDDTNTMVFVSYSVRLWDTKTHEPIGSPMKHSGTVYAVFSPDGRFVLTGGMNDNPRLWERGPENPQATRSKASPLARCVLCSAPMQRDSWESTLEGLRGSGRLRRSKPSDRRWKARKYGYLRLYQPRRPGVRDRGRRRYRRDSGICPRASPSVNPCGTMGRF